MKHTPSHLNRKPDDLLSQKSRDAMRLPEKAEPRKRLPNEALPPTNNLMKAPVWDGKVKNAWIKSL